MVDGVANDAAWAEVPETEVQYRDPGGPDSYRMKAVVHGRTLYLLIGWKDPTETREDADAIETGPYSPWGFLFTGDHADLAFPIDGPFPGDPVAPAASTRDIWRWDARLSDPSGHARDGTVRWTREPGPDGRWFSPTPEDDEGRFADGQPPTGSIADVLARGRWRDGAWTLELARALSTGHADDRDLSGLEECPFTLAIVDKSSLREIGHDRAGGPPVLRLLLPPPVPEDRQGPFPEPRGGSGYGR
jgi:hypothetical protein